jgi:hypothetical protein
MGWCHFSELAKIEECFCKSYLWCLKALDIKKQGKVQTNKTHLFFCRDLRAEDLSL